MKKSYKKDLRLDRQRASFTFTVAVRKICYNPHLKKSVHKIDPRREDVILKTNFFRFVLIALFLFAYQASTIHSTYHLVKEHIDCHLCASSQQFDTNLHETTFPIIIESNSLELGNLEQRVVLKKPLNLTQKLLVKRTDFTGMQHFSVMPIPLGYLSTAPPYTFS